jgi:cystathionine gamma-synthase
MLFPSAKTSTRCIEFMHAKDPSTIGHLSVVDLLLDPAQQVPEELKRVRPTVYAVLYPEEKFPLAKQYWQHSGDGISSRRAESCHALYQDGLLKAGNGLRPVQSTQPRVLKGPRRYQRGGSIDKTPATHSKPTHDSKDDASSLKDILEPGESTQFIEERFGRNLNLAFADQSKLAIRRRIAGSLTANVELADAPKSAANPEEMRGVAGLSTEDVYLYPGGMSAIFNTHQMLLKARGQKKSIMFGFPYVDTLKILEKWGPGCIFYGNSSTEDLDDLERRLESGERYLALFCEFPGNPLLKSPDLKRIRALADKYDFNVVVDETIGNFINIHVLPYADAVVSSLTKIFAGEGNVMGGSMVLNPQGKYYKVLKEVALVEYEDDYWAEDALFMERNSRDFVSRIERINHNTEAICDILRAHPLVKEVYYPRFSSTRTFYDDCRTPNGGYGGLFSVTFQTTPQAIAFFDRINTAKGPSLGTNFTLTSPFVLLAHYGELDWAASFGVPADLIRISVGLEEPEDLRAIFLDALQAVEAAAVATEAA